MVPNDASPLGQHICWATHWALGVKEGICHHKTANICRPTGVMY